MFEILPPRAVLVGVIAAVLGAAEVAQADSPGGVVVLTGIARDFRDSHVDFESTNQGSDPGIVSAVLGRDGNPVYSGQVGNPTTHGAAAFAQWYEDVPGVNTAIPVKLELEPVFGQPGTYRYFNPQFFPLDGLGFGNQGRQHNYHFTFEVRTSFTYLGGESFSFTGDDDLWVFINGHLAVDLGGVHMSLQGSVDLDAAASQLGIEVGQTYEFALFFAERHTTESKFEITTSIALQFETCDNGADDDGDELVDCSDPDCASVAVCECAQLWAACGGGESCELPVHCEVAPSLYSVTPTVVGPGAQTALKFLGAYLTPDGALTPDRGALVGLPWGGGSSLSATYRAPVEAGEVSWAYSHALGNAALAQQPVVWGPQSASGEPIVVGQVGTLSISGWGWSNSDTVTLPSPLEVLDVQWLDGSSPASTSLLVLSVFVPDQPALVGSHDVSVSRPDTGWSAVLADALVVAPRPPHLSDVDPGVLARGASHLLTVSGSNLRADAEWVIEGGLNAAALDSSSETSVQLAVSVPFDAPPGFRDLVVTTAYGTDTLPDAIFVTEFGLQSVDPVVLYIGESQPFAVLGAGFQPGVDWQIGAIGEAFHDPASVPDATRAESTVSVAASVVEGPRNLVVSQGGVSLTLADSVGFAWRSPWLNAALPRVVAVDSVEQLVLSGGGFSPVDLIRFPRSTGGGPVSELGVVQASLVDSATRTAVVAAPPDPGTFDCVVENPAHSATISRAVAVFGVVGVTPKDVHQGSTVVLTVSGHGFDDDLSLQLGPGVTVNETIVLTSNLVAATVAIHEDCALGLRALHSERSNLPVAHAFPDALRVLPAVGSNPAPVTLLGCSPASALRGESLTVTCSGTGFESQLIADLGAGIDVTGLVVQSASQFEVALSVQDFAPIGPRDASVATSDAETTLENGFEVLGAPLAIVGFHPEPVWVPGDVPYFDILGTGFTQSTSAQLEPGITALAYDVIGAGSIRVQSKMGPTPGRYDATVHRGAEQVTVTDALTVFGLVALAPSTVAAGGSVQVTGYGGLPSGTTLIDPMPGSVGAPLSISTVGADGDTLTANIVAPADTPLGPRDVVVHYGTRTHVLASGLAVVAGPPVVTRAVPDAMEIHQERVVAVHGLHLVNCAASLSGATLVSWQSESPNLALLTLLSGGSAGAVGLSLTCAGGSGTWPDLIAVFDEATESPAPSEAGAVHIAQPTSLQTFAWSPEGATVSVQVQVAQFSVGADGYVQLFLDGQPRTQILSGASGAGQATVLTGVPTGRHRLTAALNHAGGAPVLGEAARDSVEFLVKGSCASTADCVDENPCSTQQCVNNVCAYGPVTPTSGAACCSSYWDCPAGSDCIANECRQCQAHADCMDGTSCTLDSCSDAGVCVHSSAAGCCVVDAHCDDGRSCTSDSCDSQGQCVHVAALGCCDEDSECDDGNPCTNQACVKHECVFSVPAAGCCTSDAACNDSLLCTVDTCNTATHTCVHQPVASDSCCEPGDPYCCNTDAECEDGNFCSMDSCNLRTHQCEYTRIPIEVDPQCCISQSDCDDGIPCNIDRCERGHCRYGPNPLFSLPAVRAYNSCCTAEPDSMDHYTAYLGCDDFDACTVDWCDGPSFRCQHQAVESDDCCNTAADCYDADPNTLDVCMAATCKHPPDPNFCGTTADCDDSHPCTVDQCVDQQCHHAYDPGCCTSDNQCGDGDPCTADACDPQSHTCSALALTNCCQANADCDDGQACTLNACINGTCRTFDKPGCCGADADCAAESPCVVGACVDSSCVYTASKAAGCCKSPFDCDDGSACTIDSCGAGGVCYHAPLDGCCATDADCGDGLPCTDDQCVGGTCVYDGDADCCTEATQCDDGDPCTADVCQDSLCAYQTLDECGLALPVVVDPADPLYELAPPAGWTSFVFEGDGEWFWIDGKVVLLPASSSSRAELEGWLVSPPLQVTDASFTTVQLEILGEVSSAVSWQVLESFNNGLSWTPASAIGAPSQGGWSFSLRVGQQATSSIRRVAIRVWGASQEDFGALTRIAIDDGRPPLWLTPAGPGALSVAHVPGGWAAPVTAESFDPESQQVVFHTRGSPSWLTLDTYSLTTWGFSTRIRVHAPAGTTLGAPLGAIVASDGVLRSVRPIQFAPQ